MRPLLIWVIVILIGSPSKAFGQTAAASDGTILERKPCAPYVPATYSAYAEQARQSHASEVEAAKREGITMRTPLTLATPEEFERANTVSAGIECTRLMYASDGLRVAGLMWRPKSQGNSKLPLIILNRGGNRDFGRIPEWHFSHRLAGDGFVVLASQYRGVDGGEGVEEFGGADIHDVRNLLGVATSLGFVDMNNVFMFGGSRGAMQALVAVKQGMRVNAVAIAGGLLDLFTEAQRRPALVTNVWSQLMPGFATRRDELLRERSAIYWPEAIDTPVLILHGGGDWRSAPSEALTFAQKLQAAGKTYQLIVYANDDHGLTGNRADINRRIVEWFKRHMR
jgi:dipeptidyl aminopeptidase/acylaminoacyl peptidase